MSLTLPDGVNNLTLTTGSIARQFGTFQLDIDTIDSGLTGFSSTTIKLSEMPSIEIDFDLDDSVDDISDFKINAGSISFKLFDKMGDGESFYDLTQEVATNNGFVVEITALSKKSIFIFSKRDVMYDWSRRECSVVARPAFVYNSQPQEYGEYDVSALKFDYIIPSEVKFDDVVMVGDVIEQYLQAQGDISTAEVITLGSNVTDNDPNDGDVVAVVQDAFCDTYQQAQDLVLSFAVLESALVGTAMGYAFYVVRSDTSDSVTINTSDLEGFDTLNDKRYVGDFTLDFTYGDGDNGNFRTIARFTDTSTYDPYSETINVFGVQDVNVTFNLPQDSSNSFTLRGVYNSTDQDFDSTSGTTASDYVFDGDTSLQNAVDMYKKALRIDSKLISGTIFGIDTLKPYQTITLGTGFNDNLDGETFRPSYLKYDFGSDKIEFEAYSL